MEPALELHFNGLDLVGQPGVQLTVLTAEPGSGDHEALRLLGAWSAEPATVLHAAEDSPT